MIRLYFAFPLLFAIHFNVFGQVTVVKDVNTNPGDVLPDYYGGNRFCNCGNYLYFNFENGNITELWSTDGTEAGTQKILKQQGGVGGPGTFCLNNLLYFSGDDGHTGLEPWVTDGTPEGTRLIKDIIDGPESSRPGNFTFYKDKLYFTTEANDFTLWQTEGSLNSTVALQSFPAEYSNVTITASSRYLYIDYYDFNTSLYQLIRSEGSELSNVLLATPSNFITNRLVIGDHFFYTNYTTDYHTELWINDEISNTMVKLIDSQNIYGLQEYNDKLICTGGGTWISDGTEIGTKLISGSSFDNGILHSGLLYGFSYNGDTYLLVKTDGSTVLPVSDLSVPSSDFLGGPLAILNGKFILSSSTSETGTETIISDLTSEGTRVIKDINQGSNGSRPSSWTTFNNKVFFLANDGIHGREIWMTDGTEIGTKLLKDVSSGTEDGGIADPVLFKNHVYFLGTPDGIGAQLLKAKENDPVQLIETIETRPRLMGKSNDYLYFFQGVKLIRSDGEQPSTLVRDFSGQLSQFGFTGLNNGFELNNKLIFRFSTYSGQISLGNEFWVTDGTELGTHVLRDINPGAADGLGLPYGAVLNQHLIFNANDGTSGLELWTSDGTESGTLLLKDINAGVNASEPYGETALNNFVLFGANDGTHGKELWRTDGTAPGTFLVKDINSGSNGSNVNQMTPVGDQMFFWAMDDTNGWALWKTDGTESGTVLVKDIAPGTGTSGYLTATETRLFLTGDDGAHGNELWVSDGTTTGTAVIDVVLGTAGSNPSLLAAGDGVVFFTTNHQLWVSDGTGANTFMIADIAPEKVIYQNGWLYFTAYTPAYGIEVYKLQLIKKDQTIEFSVSNKVYGENPFEISAISSSGMPVSFTTSSDKISLHNNIISLLQPGRATVKASQAGSALYNAAPEVSSEFCINPVQPQIISEDLVTSAKLTSSSTEGNVWFLNGELIANAISSTLTVTQSGVYNVQVDIDNCTSKISADQSILIKETVTGIDESIGGIYLSPNPAVMQLHIQSSNENPAEIEIYSFDGKLLDRFTLESNSFINYSLHNYSPGHYMARFSAGGHIQVSRFVKE